MQNKHQNQVRIIGGSMRGRKITFCDSPQEALRPTPDRIRETVFNWLTPHIQNAICLDAFAGSGALGFEALSRGARHVTWIDSSPKTVQEIKKNIEHFHLPLTHFNLCCMDTLAYLDSPSVQVPFDIIFLDPPFQKNLLIPCMQYIHKHHLLNTQGYLYSESSEPLINIPEYWQVFRSKKAGNVYYYLLIIQPQ